MGCKLTTIKWLVLLLSCFEANYIESHRRRTLERKTSADCTSFERIKGVYTAEAGYVGWVQPGKLFSLRHSLEASYQGHTWVAPQLNRSSLCARRECFTVRRWGFEQLKCFSIGYEGFWWGKPFKVSKRKACKKAICSFTLKRFMDMSVSETKSSGLPIHALLEVVKPKPPTPLTAKLNYRGLNSIKVSIKRNAGGFFWFKPLLWRSAGWYSTANITHFGTHSKSFQAAFTFPLAFKENLAGEILFYDKNPN
ncbi:hypothetical protein DSO57_1007758 [Entomophthora muscae]|uniref:Uncharacterized protein n=1 Tax=Entomophthora muscae TaxID=34485 RepID=A0ACC2UHW9_9FUNG|nr:hypothetical protein DSO57_1007758 [Entomophthora muscae]